MCALHVHKAKYTCGIHAGYTPESDIRKGNHLVRSGPKQEVTLQSHLPDSYPDILKTSGGSAVWMLLPFSHTDTEGTHREPA